MARLFEVARMGAALRDRYQWPEADTGGPQLELFVEDEPITQHADPVEDRDECNAVAP